MNTQAKKKTISKTQWTSLSKKTVFKTLPSGAEVELKRISLLEEASNGHISTELVNVAMESQNLVQGNPTKNKLADNQLSGMMEIINTVTVLAVVNPRITEDDVTSIPIDDRMFIFNFINTVPGSKDLEPFRTE